MSSKTSKKTTSQTVTKNGKTVKTVKIIEKSTDESGNLTIKTTIKEITHNKDGSTSTTSKTSTTTTSKEHTIPSKTLIPASDPTKK